MKLFHSSDPSLKKPGKVHKPAGVKRWINVFDRADVLSYKSQPVFDGVEDFEYFSGRNGPARAWCVLASTPLSPATERPDPGASRMTLVVSRNQSDPQTHALVIGVNAYPHLIGGIEPRIHSTMGLGQLTSPVLSARRFATWLENDYYNPDAPLASVELLLSPDDGLSSASIETATFQNIKAAFGRWHQRCNTSQDSIAIFYFCGHGLDVHITVLLPEDFGCDPLNPWDTAIDFTLTFTNLADLKAKTQCFFLDACREQPMTTLSAGGRLGARALKSSTPSHFPHRDAPILKAAPIGEKANSVPKRVSFFTEALVDCLGARRSSKAENVRLGSHYVIP